MNAALCGRRSVLHLDTGRQWRGGQAQALALANGLARRGLRSVVVCPPRSPLAERAAGCGLELQPQRLRGEWDVGAAARIALLARSQKAWVIHAHSAHALALALLARALLPRAARPLVVGARRVDYSIFRHSFLGLNACKYRAADMLIAVSRCVRDVLVRDGLAAARIRVVRDGIDPAAFGAAELRVAGARWRRRWGWNEEVRVIGHVAALVGHKGQRHLLDAFALLAGRDATLRLAVVGDGPLGGALRAQARALGVGARVRWVGRVAPADVPGILHAFDVVAHPSTEEGCGSAVLEAMAARRPVVATAAGGLGELIEEGRTGLLVPPGNPPALAAAIEACLRRPALARSLAVQARAWVERHGAHERMVSETLGAYGEAWRLRRRRRARGAPPGKHVP